MAVAGFPEVANTALAQLRTHDDAPLADRVDRTLAVALGFIAFVLLVIYFVFSIFRR